MRAGQHFRCTYIHSLISLVGYVGLVGNQALGADPMSMQSGTSTWLEEEKA